MKTILTLILLTALAGCSTIIDKTASAIPGCSASDIQVKSFVPGVMSDTLSVMCHGKEYTCAYSGGKVYNCTSPNAEQSTGIES